MKKETKILLKSRAVEMAKEPQMKISETEGLEVITFSLATENYGIESVFIREVYPLKDFTPLPGVPSYILGIFNIHGQILPVIDLKKFFNLPIKGLVELNKVIILRNEQMEFGILADIIHGTQTIELDDIKVVPPTVSGIREMYLKGVTNNKIIILNAEKILMDESIIVNSEVN
jgi:purine-binding chemotaxis protein CheW